MKVICQACAEKNPKQSGGRIEQWELPVETVLQCEVCGEKYGPFPDFRKATTYNFAIKSDPAAAEADPNYNYSSAKADYEAFKRGDREQEQQQ